MQVVSRIEPIIELMNEIVDHRHMDEDLVFKTIEGKAGGGVQYSTL